MAEKERYYSLSLLKSLAYEDDVNGNCDGMIDFTVIDSIGGVDVEKVRHGEWLPYPYDAYMKCSVCGMEYRKSRMPEVVGFCPNPNCGAKMDGGNKQ